MKRDDYTIALICALPVELAAARAVLSKPHDVLPQEASDDNIYILGSIGEHNVIITSLPAGTMGTAPAAVVATRLQSSFPSVRVGLMVGIGGGIPSEEHDIRLGDVVVSQPTGTSGGVIQYDLGKTIQEGKFQMIGQLNRPPPVLLNAVQSLRSESILGKSKLNAIMAEMAAQHPSICTFPGTEDDVLFEANFDHPVGEPTCSLCDRSRVAIRKTRSNTGPEVHYGLIASGNQVIKHGLTRNKLGREQGALCVEMEAAGLMDSFPCLVIRGICDYADSHKNKKWQPYAALTAAAYAKELINFIPHRKVAETRLAVERIQDFDKMVFYRPQIDDFTAKPREAWSLEHHKDPRSWKILVSRISDYDRSKAQRRLSRGRVEGTTEWFLQHPHLQKWLENESFPSLWCSGGIGSGKTTICTSLIDYLMPSKVRPNTTLLFFYCEASERKTLEARYMMSSLVRQVLDVMSLHAIECPWDIRTQIDYLYNPTGPEPDLEDMVHIFSRLYLSVPGIICIVDGLDDIEPKDLSKVVDAFNTLSKKPSEQKLFIASRDQIGLNVQLNFTLHVQLLPLQTEADIKMYIEAEISRKSDQERMITESPQLLQLVKDRLFEEAHGMFLWVRLQIEALWLDCFCDDDIHSALASLPRDIDATYDRCIARMPARTRDLAAKTLRWLTCAHRPLHFQELQEVVSYSLKDTFWNSAKTTSLIVIFSACVNLITIDHSDSTVRLAHPSIKQYLFRSNKSVLPGFSSSEVLADLQCGEECVNYLTFSDFGLQLRNLTGNTTRTVFPSPDTALAQIPLPSFASKWIRTVARTSPLGPKHVHVSIPTRPQKGNEFKFLDYARKCWAIHTKSISRISPTWDQFRDLALQPNVSWKLHPWISSGQSHDSHLHGLLIWASRERHIPLLKLLLDECDNGRVRQICNIPSVDAGLPALHIAVRQGFLDVVSILLKVCDVNSFDGGSRTALHHCAEKNHVAVAEDLVSIRTIKPSVISKLGETALGIACGHGFREIVQLLARVNSSMKPKGDTTKNPVVAAAKNGHLEILKFLLLCYSESSLGSDVGSSCVCHAAGSGHWSTVTFLLGCKHVSADWTDELGQTPLSFAALCGQEEVVKLLLERTDVVADSKDWFAQTPLMKAAIGGHEGTVKLLVERDDVSINLPNHEGHTPLALAVASGSEAIVKLLLGRDNVSVNLPNQEGHTPLALAVASGSEAIVKLLLERDDVSINLPNREGQTPLSIAAASGSEAIVKLLLERDDFLVNLQNRKGQTPLFIAAASGSEAIVKLLLERDNVSINLPNHEGQTPLSIAAASGSEAIVKLLLECLGILVTWKDRSGRTPLLLAAATGHAVIIELLFMRAQVSISWKDNNGRTPLSHAAGNGHTSVTRLLVGLDIAQVNIQDRGGFTPLHWATLMETESTVRELLKSNDIDVNLQDTELRTPLSYASKQGNEFIVQLLLGSNEISADLDDSKGRTPLFYAAAAGHEPVVRILACRSDVNTDNNDCWGNTPLSAARQNGHMSVVKLLRRLIKPNYDEASQEANM